ncbi:phosphatidylinositol 4-phosphate 5-kinase 10-like [Typha latifolia]|uniref:phosphatidylinositol 4-phosphate 5-kinase 10-like n=1 Tax=Typha latifolia TaxID=4733 RepID=UPI003C2E2CF5
MISQKEFSLLDFASSSTYCIQLPSNSSTDSRAMCVDFQWTDYCTEVFRTLQELQDIDADGYIVSIRNHETIMQLSSAKKTGAPFQLSHNKKFIVKIISKCESKVLLQFLPNYFRHMQKYKNSLLTKFYGLHVVKASGGKKVRFLVMGHILRSDLSIHKQFNFKSSLQGRFVAKSKSGLEEDLNIAFYLDTSTRTQILSQVKHDCDFLEEEGIVDYGLLLGMHVSATPFDAVTKCPSSSVSIAGSNDSKREHSDADSSLQSDSDQDSISDGDSQSSTQTVPQGKLGLRMPARAVDVRRMENYVVSRQRARKEEKNNVVLYLGIVDILQGYSILKRVEQVFRSLQQDSLISTSASKVYALRFQELLCTIFRQDESDSNKL